LAAALEVAFDAVAQGEIPPGGAPVKRSRAREVLYLELPTGEAVYLKRDRIAGSRWRRPGVEREHANLLGVRAAGFAAVEPLALAEHEGATGAGLWLVTRALRGALPLSERLREAEPSVAEALLREAASLARRLHDEGLWHRDLHPGNLLVRDDGLHLVDLQKLRKLPFSVPTALRVRDLVGLVSDGRPQRLPARIIAEAYANASPGGLDPDRLATRLAGAAARAVRSRLRSRGRRCVVASTGFRMERRGQTRVFRRSDVSLAAALEAAAQAGTAEALQLPEFIGGPEAGPAPDLFARGQGAAEAGAPAQAPAQVRRFGWGLGVRGPFGLAHPGMRAWRLAHALMLRGVETPAPLALVERRRLGFVSHSLLVTRCASEAPALPIVLAGEPERARAVGRELARWHARGVEVSPLGPRWRSEDGGLIASHPERARLHGALSEEMAERDLAAVSAPLGTPEAAALREGYEDFAPE
jgi:Ser/Thr protein kinase RdoA (MazF antagonist)